MSAFTRFVLILPALALCLMVSACGGGGGGGSTTVAPPPPGPTYPSAALADFTGTWGVSLDGASYADWTFDGSGNLTTSSNSDYVAGSGHVTISATPTTFTITETNNYATPAPPGTIVTTYTGHFTNSSKAHISGTYTWTATNSTTGSGTWTADKGGLAIVTATLADFAGLWAVDMDGAGYAQFTFNSTGGMTANSNSDYVGGSGSVALNSPATTFTITEGTSYTTPTPAGTITTTYVGHFSTTTKDSMTGTYSWTATNGMTGSGTWSAIKAPTGSG
ncbi:MAG: hypothetical protein H0W83_00135 [Planctomycetes bacterium]|nr:hypothetical protein [Planctomycetota bacterium]